MAKITKIKAKDTPRAASSSDDSERSVASVHHFKSSSKSGSAHSVAREDKSSRRDASANHRKAKAATAQHDSDTAAQPQRDSAHAKDSDTQDAADTDARTSAKVDSSSTDTDHTESSHSRQKSSRATKSAKSTQPAKPAKRKRKREGYFRGAWKEIRQVRWPNRKATWQMFLAVVLYSALFIVVIMLLDAFFSWIFSLILA